MPAVPILLAIAGYWVLYAGIKRVSLLDAWNCTASPQKAPVAEPGGVSRFTPGGRAVAVGAGRDCAQRPGDVVLPGGWIWRPVGSGLLGQVAGILVRRC